MYGVGVGLSPVRGTPDYSILGGPTSAAGLWLCCMQGPPAVGVKGGTVGDAGKQMAAPSFRQHSLVQ